MSLHATSPPCLCLCMGRTKWMRNCAKGPGRVRRQCHLSCATYAGTTRAGQAQQGPSRLGHKACADQRPSAISDDDDLEFSVCEGITLPSCFACHHIVLTHHVHTHIHTGSSCLSSICSWLCHKPEAAAAASAPRRQASSSIEEQEGHCSTRAVKPLLSSTPCAASCATWPRRQHPHH